MYSRFRQHWIFPESNFHLLVHDFLINFTNSLCKWSSMSLSYTTNERFLIWFSSSRQVDVFDPFMKICFFNSFYLVSLKYAIVDWLIFNSSLLTIQYCPASKTVIASTFLKMIAMIHIHYGPLLQTYVCKALNLYPNPHKYIVALSFCLLEW